MPYIQDVVKNDAGEDVTISIEVDEAAGRSSYRDTRGAGQQAQEAFQKAMELIHTCAEQIATTVQTVSTKVRPRGSEVQFAVTIETEVGVVIAKASMEAQFQVTLKWEQKDSTDGKH